MPPNNIVSKIGDRRGGLHIRPCPAATGGTITTRSVLGGYIIRPYSCNRTGHHGTKNAPVSKRQRRNPLRYHSHCRYSGPSTAGNGRVRPGLLPEGFGGKLRGDTSPRRAACFHHPQALLGRGPWILVLVIAFFRYLPYNTPFSGICQARKRKLSHMRLCP